MKGTNAHTGAPLDGTAHLKQSIADILITPIGSRVMRRTYGSLLMQLIDQPFTPAVAVRLYASIAEALMRWEPRIRLRTVRLVGGSQPGKYTITVEAQRTDVAQPNTIQQFSIPLLTGQTA